MWLRFQARGGADGERVEKQSKNPPGGFATLCGRSGRSLCGALGFRCPVHVPHKFDRAEGLSHFWTPTFPLSSYPVLDEGALPSPGSDPDGRSDIAGWGIGLLGSNRARISLIGGGSIDLDWDRRLQRHSGWDSARGSAAGNGASARGGKSEALHRKSKAGRMIAVPTTLVIVVTSYLTLGISDPSGADRLWAVYAVTVAVLTIINLALLVRRDN